MLYSRARRIVLSHCLSTLGRSELPSSGAHSFQCIQLKLCEHASHAGIIEYGRIVSHAIHTMPKLHLIVYYKLGL